MKSVSCLPILILLIAVPAASQSIPVEIPDTPGESPVDREREIREERYRPWISRMYMSTNVGAAPLLHRNGTVLDSFVEAGIKVTDGFTLFIYGGPRIAPRMVDDPRLNRQSDGGWAGALGADLGMGHSENWRLSIATGTWTSEIDLFYTEVSPRYIHPLNQYWQLSVGGKATLATFSQGGVFLFAGPSIGIRRSFGQRMRFE